MVNNLPAKQETQVWPLVGKIPWRRDVNPLQYTCLENSMDRGARQVIVHWVAKSWMRLNDFHCIHYTIQVLDHSVCLSLDDFFF